MQTLKLRPRIRVVRLNRRNPFIMQASAPTVTKAAATTPATTPAVTRAVTKAVADKPQQKKKSQTNSIKLKSSIRKLEPEKLKPTKKSLADTQALEARLFSDVKAIFKLQAAKILRTQSILDALADNKPWSTISQGRPLNARRLALLLSPYGIHSKDLRFGNGRAYKGFKREWFKSGGR